jgi:hypothetical protein
MESIPLEQLALTCRTLHDNRILDLYREKEQEKEQLKPKCIYNSTNDTFEIVHPYGTTIFYAESNHPEILNHYRDLSSAIKTGQNYLMETSTMAIEKRHNVDDGLVNIIYSSNTCTLIKPELLLPALETLLSHHE